MHKELQASVRVYDKKFTYIDNLFTYQRSKHFKKIIDRCKNFDKIIKYNNTVNKSKIKLKQMQSTKEREGTLQRRRRTKNIKMKGKY